MRRQRERQAQGLDRDAELVALGSAQDGCADPTVLHSLYLHLQPHITRWVTCLNREGLLCRPDVDDFLQDAYVLLLNAVRSYDPARPGAGLFRTFLERIITRRFRNRRCARRLPGRQRYVLKAVAAGRSASTIAAHLRCSLRTALRLKRDTIVRVRRLLNAESYD